MHFTPHPLLGNSAPPRLTQQVVQGGEARRGQVSVDVQGDPVPLREGSMLHFAASSREYVLRLEGALESEPQHDSAAANAAAEPPVRLPCTVYHLQQLPRVCLLLSS